MIVLATAALAGLGISTLLPTNPAQTTDADGPRPATADTLHPAV